jgi:hypothetical protein
MSPYFSTFGRWTGCNESSTASRFRPKISATRAISASLGSCSLTDTNSPSFADCTAVRIRSRSSGLTSRWSLRPSPYIALSAIMISPPRSSTA